MADTDAQPMTDQDIETPPATTQFEPAEPLKTSGVDFEPEATLSDSADEATNVAGTTQSAREGVTSFKGQAADKLRAFAQDGQTRAAGALDQLVQVIHDAADQVDDKLGAQYGDYARQAAGTVSGYAEAIKNKDVDELFDDARAIVRRSPAIAVGGAAAIGFVLARLVQSGLEEGRTSPGGQV